MEWPLGAYFLVAALSLCTPILLIAAVFAQRYITSETALIDAKLAEKSRWVISSLDREVASLKGMLEALATSPAIDEPDLRRFDRQARQIGALAGVTIVARDLTGQQKINTQLTLGTKLPMDINVATDRLVIDSREPRVSDLLFNATDGESFTSITVPVIRNGNVTQVLAANIRPDLVATILQTATPREQEFHATVIDSKGLIVSESRSEYRLTGTPFEATPLTRLGVSALWDGASEQALTSIEKSSVSHWSVVLGVDRAAVLVPFYWSMASLSGLTLLLIGLSVAMSHIIIRVLRSGFARVTKSAEALRLGIPVKHERLRMREMNRIEIALEDASHHILHQARTLAALAESLESRVEERTDQLAVSVRRARHIADSLPHLVWIATADGTMTYGNGRMIEQFPGACSSIEERTKFYHPDDLPEKLALRMATVAEHGSLDAEWRIADATGSYRWHRVMMRPLGKESDATEWICSAIDIDETRKDRQALEAAREVAELASQAKTNFLATMSHEIRTPLTGVLGFANMLLSEPLTSEQRRKMGSIKSAGLALLTVVNDILDFSKVEAGQLELEHHPLNLRELLDEAVTIVQNAADQKALELNVVCAQRAPETFIGDISRIRQILLNLLNNAIKFTSRGSVTLTVDIEDQLAEEVGLCFQVSDTGIGVASEEFERLFERFSQLDDSTARHFGGTGLGLAISKNLVTLMGGTIGVESKVGVGSTFWFRIRLPLAEMFSALPITQDECAPMRSLRILLADDNEFNQEIARASLESWGHVVDAVPDGALAVKAMAGESYDLVLMDIQMPVMDGVSATRAIRRAEADQPYKTPIIAMTANVLPEQLASFKAAGLDGHIGKPFTLRELKQIVRTYAASEGTRHVEAFMKTIDQARFAELAQELGGDTTTRLLGILAVQMTSARNWGDHMSLPELAWECHRLVAPTGMIGLTALSNACAALEAACHNHGDIDEALTAFHLALGVAEDALREKLLPV